MHIWLDNDRFMELWQIAASEPAINPFLPAEGGNVENLLANHLQVNQELTKV